MADTIIVTRHAGAIEWLRRKGITGEVVSHVESAEQVRGKVVIGNLPLHLAAEAQEVLALDMNLPAEKRGQDLTPEEMDQYGARLTRYTVTRIGASMYPCFCEDDNGKGLEVIQDDGRWAVECQACFIQGDWMETPEEAIAAWNASQAADLKKMFAK